MTSVNDLSGRPSGPWPDHIAGLLGGALRRLREEILAVSDDFPGLRVSHYRLLELIPPDGARITDLAEVALMTKQALGQHVDYLQGLGYTESDRLRADRRVRLVRRTARGRRRSRSAGPRSSASKRSGRTNWAQSATRNSGRSCG